MHPVSSTVACCLLALAVPNLVPCGPDQKVIKVHSRLQFGPPWADSVCLQNDAVSSITGERWDEPALRAAFAALNPGLATAPPGSPYRWDPSTGAIRSRVWLPPKSTAAAAQWFAFTGVFTGVTEPYPTTHVAIEPFCVDRDALPASSGDELHVWLVPKERADRVAAALAVQDHHSRQQALARLVAEPGVLAAELKMPPFRIPKDSPIARRVDVFELGAENGQPRLALVGSTAFDRSGATIAPGTSDAPASSRHQDVLLLVLLSGFAAGALWLLRARRGAAPTQA